MERRKFLKLSLAVAVASCASKPEPVEEPQKPRHPGYKGLEVVSSPEAGGWYNVYTVDLNGMHRHQKIYIGPEPEALRDVYTSPIKQIRFEPL